MCAAPVTAGLGSYLMWHAPHGLPPTALLAFMIAMLIFVNIAFSLYEIPSVALAPELAPDYQQRSSLLAYRWVFLILGANVISIILYQVFLRQDAANPLGVLNRARWEAFGLTSAAIIFVVILLSTAATHGRIKHLHTPTLRRTSLAENLAEIRVALTHRPLLMIMFGGLFMGFAAGTTAGLAAYFSLHFWALKPQQLAWFSAAGVAGAFAAMWIGPRLGGRFGKRQAIIGLYIGWLVTATGPISLRLLGLMPANGTAALLAIPVANIFVAITLALSCHINLGSAVA